MNVNKIKVKMMKYALLTSISKKNDSNKHQTSDSHNSKDKNVLKISPWHFASNVNQESIGLKQGKCS